MHRRDVLIAALSAAGALIGSPTLRVLAGEAPTSQPAAAVLDSRQRLLVSELAEMIIPATDTPGAISAGVPGFIEMMVADWYTDTERAIFLAGLADLDAYSRATFGTDFLASDAAQRTQALRQAEQQAAAYQSPVNPLQRGLGGGKAVDEHTPFFAKLKELTLVGFVHSEAGATREYIYDPMPMRFEGDIDYADTGRQWSH